MTDKPQPPEGWEGETSDDTQRETIRALKEQGYDPASLDQKLRSMGHPAAASMGTDTTESDFEAPREGSGPGEPQIPGGDERALLALDEATPGGTRDRSQADEEAGTP